MGGILPLTRTNYPSLAIQELLVGKKEKTKFLKNTKNVNKQQNTLFIPLSCVAHLMCLLPREGTPLCLSGHNSFHGVGLGWEGVVISPLDELQV